MDLKLHATGTAAYDDSPGNSTEIVDSRGAQHDDVATISTAAAHIAPRDTEQAHGTFQVPDGQKVTKLQFTIDSGMGLQTAEWDL